MPYCNWCQMESDSVGSCVWCKRPFDDKPSVFNNKQRGDYHFLKTDDEASPTPYYAIFGIVCILGLAVLGFSHSRPRLGAGNGPGPGSSAQDMGWTVQPTQYGAPQSHAVTLTSYPPSGNRGAELPSPANYGTRGAGGSLQPYASQIGNSAPNVDAGGRYESDHPKG